MSKRIGLRHISQVLRRFRLWPAVWTCDNVVGVIWVEGNPPGCDTSRTGEIAIKDPYGLDELGQVQGGSCDKRV